jgi:hypothetical protein
MEITQVRLTSPTIDRPSEAARAVVKWGAAVLQQAPEHLTEITFDGGSRGRVDDFRPLLPLVFRS